MNKNNRSSIEKIKTSYIYKNIKDIAEGTKILYKNNNVEIVNLIW